MITKISCKYCNKEFEYFKKSSQSFRRFCDECKSKRKEMYPYLVKQPKQIKIDEELAAIRKESDDRKKVFCWDLPSVMI
jgi:hypothetical protein